MTILLALLGLGAVGLLNVAAFALAGQGVARLFGVRGGKLLFHHPPRQAFSTAAFAGVVVAGPIATYLCAAGLFVAALLVDGRVEVDTTVIVVPGGRAEAAGMRSADRIVSVNGTPVTRFLDLAPALEGRGEKETSFVVDRGGEHVTLAVIPDAAGKVQIRGGAPRRISVPVGEAVAAAVVQPVRVLVAFATGLLESVTPRTEKMSGPVAMVRETAWADQSFVTILAAHNASYWPLSLVIAFFARPRRRPEGPASKPGERASSPPLA